VNVQAFTAGSFGENTYVVACDRTGAAVVIDPGAAAPLALDAIAADGLDLQAVLLTHAHLDHVEGVHLIRAAAPDLPIWLHADDLGMYRAVSQQAAMFGLTVPPQPEPTDEIVPGTPYPLGESSLDVRFTPGHAQGHVVFVAPDRSFAISGDVVFQGSIGRTDLPGGDFKTLMRSIREQILTLPDETVLYSGHGPPTTVGHERVGNPFLVGHYRGEFA
jgi:hydroxyacylglutathione hydrolase